MNFTGVPGMPADVGPDVPSLARPARYIVSGVTTDNTSAILGNCTVDVFESASGRLVATTMSDPTTGVYSVDVPSSETGLTFQAVATSADGTKAGASVATLVGTPS